MALTIVSFGFAARMRFGTKTKKAPKLDAALRAWKSRCDKVESGEITAEELEFWKLEFGS